MDDLYVEKVNSGDINAFGYFVKKYKEMSYNLALSILKDPYLSEEVTQESFIKAFNNLRSFKGNAKFKTWLYRIVVNESLQKLKKVKKDYNLVPMQEHLTEIGMEEEPEDKPDLATKIQEVLKNIPAKESLALKLFYLEDLGTKEIMQITGWSNSNTKVILHRARKNLFQKLNGKIDIKLIG